MARARRMRGTDPSVYMLRNTHAKFGYPRTPTYDDLAVGGPSTGAVIAGVVVDGGAIAEEAVAAAEVAAEGEPMAVAAAEVAAEGAAMDVAAAEVAVAGVATDGRSWGGAAFAGAVAGAAVVGAVAGAAVVGTFAGAVAGTAVAVGCVSIVFRKANSAMADDNQPVTTKTTHRGENDRLEYAVSSMQGYGGNMEDAHAAFEDFDVPTATSFFGVYDGHGGPDVSMYCARHLHLEIRKHPEFTNDLPTAVDGAFFRMDQMMTTDEGRMELTRYWDRKLTLKDMFLRCARFEDHPGPIEVGSTACVALIRGNQIIVGNAGDCRCVLSRNRQAIVLTTDHKPSVLDERQRILNAGHFVEVTQGVSRVDNEIAVARSIGDMRYKSNIALPPALQALTCAPEIRSENITDDAEFLVMACNGVWDVVENQGLIDYIHELLENAMNLGEICEALLDWCVQRSRDNMTVLLVQFKHNAQAPDVPQCELPGAQQEDQSALRTSSGSRTDDELQSKKTKAPLELEL